MPVDEQLRTWLAEGAYDPALTLLAETYRGPLLRYCLHLCQGQTALAEESTQQTLAAACHGIAQFRAAAAAHTWLFAIARREVLHALARQRRQWIFQQRFTRWRQTQAPPASCVTPEDRVSAHDVARLRMVLTRAALAPLDRSIIVLRFGIEVPQALSVAEIATVLRLSRATVYRRLTQLLTRLRRLMDQELPAPGRCAPCGPVAAGAQRPGRRGLASHGTVPHLRGRRRPRGGSARTAAGPRPRGIAS
jgi:RNA polymerase sigma factor (sigma-70 family)